MIWIWLALCVGFVLGAAWAGLGRKNREMDHSYSHYLKDKIIGDPHKDCVSKDALRKLVEWLREEQADCQLTMPTMATAYGNVADRIEKLLGGE